MTWRDRALEHSAAVQRTRARTLSTADRIVGAARQLLAESGDDFTVQALADRSGIALQTLYRYFPSKDVVLLAVFEETIREGYELVRDSTAGVADPLERLHGIVVASIPGPGARGPGITAAALVNEHLRLAKLFPREVEQAQRPYIELVRDVIAAAVADGSLAPRPDVEVDARLVTYLVRSVYQARTATGATDDHTVVAEQVWRFCASGLGFDPDRAVTAPVRSRRSRPA